MAQPVEQTVETGVDELMKLLSSHDKMPIVEVAKKLGIAQDVVQSWIDFLVEEKILGIEYKFTVPYVYLNVPLHPERQVEEEVPKTLADFKREFNEKAESTLPQSRGKVLVLNLWKQHLQAELDRKKSWFISEAGKRNLDDSEGLWTKYQKKVMDV